MLGTMFVGIALLLTFSATAETHSPDGTLGNATDFRRNFSTGAVY